MAKECRIALKWSDDGSDGYNVGWNNEAVAGQGVFHVHLHVVLRFADEPYAGRGIRWWLKQDENRRPGDDARAPM